MIEVVVVGMVMVVGGWSGDDRIEAGKVWCREVKAG